MMHRPAQTWQLPLEHIGRQVLVFESLPSTNDFAIAHAPELESGTVIIAREQSAGRGNYGRSWLSPGGAGVWMTIVVRPPAVLLRPVVAIAWVGVSVAETIRLHINQQPALKWPNDVLVRGRKIAGILIEQTPVMIVGVGVNVNQSGTQLLADGLADATSMAVVAGRSFDIDAVARDLIAQLNNEYGLLVAGEITTLESCWKWRMGLLGREVVVEHHGGHQSTGRILEMSFAGLSLQTAIGLEQLAPELVKHVSEIANSDRSRT